MLNQVTKLNNGRIVLVNGDCLIWLPQIRSKADMIFADLPYGTTQNKWDSIIPLDQLWSKLKGVALTNTAYVLTAITPFHIKLGASNYDQLKYDLIWRKKDPTGHLNAKIQPMRQHEHILVFYEKQCTYNPQMRYDGKPYSNTHTSNKRNYGNEVKITRSNNGERYPISIIETTTHNKGLLHPTQKPVELLEYLIRTYTNENDLVIDPTMGVGTTGVACAKLNRRFIGIELDTTEGYYETAINRIQEVLDVNPT